VSQAWGHNVRQGYTLAPAFSKLHQILTMGRFFQQDQLNELEEQGLIKAFEYTYELSWHTLRDYMQYQGNI